MLLALTGCEGTVKKNKDDDLMEDIKGKDVTEKSTDGTFTDAQMKLAWNLFYESAKRSGEENTLISPLSLTLALAMTANGAEGETRAEMEDVLADGYTLEELNQYLYTYTKNLPSNDDYKLNIANSIWFRDEENRLTVEEDFLQLNADYYGAEIYKSAFDGTTVQEMNQWVKEYTDGMIDQIVDEIPYDTVMYLLNAITFDAKWADEYIAYDVKSGTFTAVNGTKQDAEFMCSIEHIYLEDELMTGFVKHYKENKYSFAALLPKDESEEGIYDLMQELRDGEVFANLIENQKKESVEVELPKFSYEYEMKMNPVLEELGIVSAFNGMTADFSGLGKSTNGNIWIDHVLHKTFIEVNEIGTKAGAVTKVEMVDESAMIGEKMVSLDRPFVYVIMDNETNLPVFIGTVLGAKGTEFTTGE